MKYKNFFKKSLKTSSKYDNIPCKKKKAVKRQCDFALKPKRRKALKNSIKTLAMWLIVGVIFVVLLTSILDNADTKMTYAELINKIETSEVTKIEMSYDGKTANVTLKNDAVDKEVNIPSVESFMDYVTDYLKAGTIDLKERPQSILITILEILSPFGLLIIALLFWFFTMNSSASRK